MHCEMALKAFQVTDRLACMHTKHEIGKAPRPIMMCTGQGKGELVLL